MDYLKEIRRFLADLKYNIQVARGKFDYVGKEYANKSLSDAEYAELCNRLYGNQYLKSKYTDYDSQMVTKRWLVDLILTHLPSVKNVLDIGANRGHIMQVFKEKGLDVYGFDILEDLSEVFPDLRANYKTGDVLKSIPEFPVTFDLVTSFDVFEHLPINMVPKAAENIKKLNARYLVFQISKDRLNDGHIALKGTDFWVSQFSDKYRVMTELYPSLSKWKTVSGEYYRYTGIPKNDFNQVPGIVFFERK